jgi:hypothetical protein
VTDIDPATLLGSSSSRTESGESRKTAPVSASVSTSRADHDAAETSRTGICSGSKPGSALVVEGTEPKPPEVSPVRDLVNLEPLPGRESKRDAADWKMLYKIGSNWCVKLTQHGAESPQADGMFFFCVRGLFF